MTGPLDDLAASLAEVRGSLDLPPGVVLAVMRVPDLDPLIERMAKHLQPAGVRSGGLPRPVLDEVERTVELLSGPSLGSAPEAISRRSRLVEVLRLADDGRLPVLAADPEDAFGAELRVILATDPDLRATLGRLHPLIIRATAVAPGGRWLDDARLLTELDDDSKIRSAVHRVLAILLRAEITSRPDLLLGGLRLTNQRLARGLLWIESLVDPAPAALLGAIGVRMGTSGRHDAVVRDVALANTCAALLGAAANSDATAALASMRVRVTNRNVLKQVDRALESIAHRRGVPVETVIELALPTFGLDAGRRLERDGGGARVIVEVGSDGAVTSTWILSDGATGPTAPAEIAASHPAQVASIADVAEAIRSALSEERSRMEVRLASERAWPHPIWQDRFRDHPIGGLFGSRLIWTIRSPGSTVSAVPQGDHWLTIDGRQLDSDRLASSTLRLWHPADADDDTVMAWRATLASAGIRQPIRQVDREVFRPPDGDPRQAADRRFAGRIVDQAQMRALLRGRGWSAPALGSWDQGDEATASRAFDAGIHAELRYQAVGRAPASGPMERARLIGVRFVMEGPGDGGGSPARPGSDGSDRPGPSTRVLATVPPRVVSEALRDVSLVAIVGDRIAPEG